MASPHETSQEDDIAAWRQAQTRQILKMMETWISLCPPLSFVCSDISNPLVDLMKAHFKPPQQKPASPPPSPPPETAIKPFLAGLEAYQKHPVVREKEIPAKIVWAQGTTKLREYKPEKQENGTVFIIPSLINRYNILDLKPDHSLVRCMAKRGLRSFIVDWDEPGEEEKNFTISDYVTKRLFPALDAIKKERVHILGYCMGGLLALALALLRPERAHTLTLMATPWNFKAAFSSGETFLSLAEKAEPYLMETKCFPPEALQAFFSGVQPEKVVDKFSRFATLDPASPEAERFVLSEDWLNEGVPLAAPVARECLREWYGENRPGRILWRVANTLIDPRIVDCPTYIIAPGKDKLVPPESAKPLARLIRNTTLQVPQFGHIGLLASHAAPQEIWEPMTNWLLRQ